MDNNHEPECIPIHSAYFDGLAISPRHKRIFLIIMLAYFFEQMDNLNFGFVAQAMFDSWGLDGAASNHAMSIILTWYFIGMTFGGFLGGIISDRIGRRKTFLGSIVLFSVSSVITGLPIDNLWVFTFFRALTGFGVFCMMVCSQVYIAEMAPAESRGRWQGTIAAVGFCAIPVVGFLCTLVVPLAPEAWRYIFYFGGLGLIGFFAGLKYLAESPRWLVSNGRVAEGEQIIQDITGHKVDLSAELARVEQKSSILEEMRNVFSRRYLSRTLLLLLLFISVTPATFLISSWTPKLLSTIMEVDIYTGEQVRMYTQRMALGIMTLISCGIPLGCFLASRIAEWGGRKIPLCLSFLGAGITSVAFTYAYAHPYAAVAVGALLSTLYMSGSMILFSYAAESFPTRIRSTATGTLNAAGRLSVAAFQSLMPAFLVFFSVSGKLNQDVTIIFMTCAVLFLLPLPLVLLFGQRTGGKCLEDIS